MTETQDANRFSSFLNLGSIFQKKNTNKNNVGINHEHIVAQADSFLEAQALVPFVKMQAHGYVATPKQQDIFDNFFNQLILKNDVMDIAKLLDSGLNLTHRQYSQLVLDANIQIFCFPLSQPGSVGSISTIKKSLTQYCDKPEYNNAAFNYLIDSMTFIEEFFKTPNATTYKKQKAVYEKINAISPSINFANTIDILTQDLPLSRYSQTIAWLTKIDKLNFTGRWDRGTEGFNSAELDRQIENINTKWAFLTKHLRADLVDKFETRYPTQIQAILENTKAAYMDNYVTHLAKKQSIKISDDYNLNDLPENEKNLVNKIKTQYADISSHYHTLNEEDKHNMMSLVQEKLPKYLHDFLSMKEEYRNTMTNTQGKTAQMLLNESLSNISQHLESIDRNIHERKLTELSVGARYTGQKNKF